LRSLAPVILAIGALYGTIWPHELGHSVAAYLYGCKANWWHTYMSWFFWDSWAGPVDYHCLEAKGRLALGLTDFAGVGVNLSLLGLAPLVGRWWRLTPPKGSVQAWVLAGTVFWALANYGEAFSYLVLNTLWLSSDMRTVVLASGITRWAWFALGMAGAVLVWRILRRPLRAAGQVLESAHVSVDGWQAIFAAYVIVLSVAMGTARIVLKPPV
jgi:hypothetical protein